MMGIAGQHRIVGRHGLGDAMTVLQHQGAAVVREGEGRLRGHDPLLAFQGLGRPAGKQQGLSEVIPAHRPAGLQRDRPAVRRDAFIEAAERLEHIAECVPGLRVAGMGGHRRTEGGLGLGVPAEPGQGKAQPQGHTRGPGLE